MFEQKSLAADFIRLMHFPLPLCVCAIATIGALVAPKLYPERLFLTYVGIFFGLCLASYAFDELYGRPLHTGFADGTLWALGIFGYLAMGLVGSYLTLSISLSLLPLMLLAAFFVAAYNLELFHAKVHNAFGFAVSWGGLTAFGSNYLHSLSVSWQGLAVSVFAVMFSLALWKLTHGFRGPLERLLDLNGRTEAARNETRQIRKTIWSVVKLQCYLMVILAVVLGLMKYFALPG